MISLKSELDVIRTVFKNNETFRFISGTSDEIVFKFYSTEGISCDITGHITGSYPSTPPLWVTDSEDARVTEAVEMINENLSIENQVLHQVQTLVKKLFEVKGLPEPFELLEQLKLKLSEPTNQLPSPSSFASHNQNSQNLSKNDSDLDEEMEDEDAEVDEDEDEEFDYFQDDDMMADDKAEDENKAEGEILDVEHQSVLAKLQERYDVDKPSNLASGNVETSKRLMKELKNIYTSDTFKKGAYNVSLVKENLYEWNIHLCLGGIDSDSPLYGDLIKLKKSENKDYIELSVTFKENFPFDPPFVRVIYPMITRGHVTHGGAVCMELLTTQGWSPAYTVEAVIMQVAATLVKGDARISIGYDPRGQYNLKNAQTSYANMMRVHGKQGWGTLSKDS